uniref:C2H2-type domain-containing protein n=1 Tax=Poecilia mexicana TaxID=48701 RepID=A0A3B3Y7A8_9TELE
MSQVENMNHGCKKTRELKFNAFRNIYMREQSNQDRISSLKQKEPEHQQIKEEQDDLEHQQIKEEQDDLEHQQIKVEKKVYNQGEEQLTLQNQETDTRMVVPVYEQTSLTESEPNGIQVIIHEAAEAENQNQGKSNPNDFGAKRDEEKKQKRHQKIEQHVDGSKQKGQENLPESSDLTKNTSSTTCQRPFSCWKCFIRKDNFNCNMTDHKGQKPFLCVTCGKGFSYTSELNVHMRVHTGEKPFSCENCGRSFSRQNNLTVHMRVHTGEKPFSCVTCGKGFSLKQHLAMHMMGHTGEKPFLCVTCGKHFTTKNSLTIHVRRHTGEKPFQCKTCGESFIDQYSLTIHTRSHTMLKPFSCVSCEKSFSQRKHLTKHMITHTGEKPFTLNAKLQQRALLISHLDV